MKRTQFYILVRNNGETKTERVKGYAETINGLPIGLHKDGAAWTVTELSTGMAFADGRTRADAIEKAQPLFDKVAGMVKKEMYKSARKMICEAYGM